MSDEPNEPNKPNDPNTSQDTSVNSNQVDLAKELSGVLEQVSDRLSKISDQTKSQTSMIVSMSESFQQISESITGIGNSTTSMVNDLNTVAESCLLNIRSNDIVKIHKDLEKVSDVASKGLTSSSQGLELLKDDMLDMTKVHVDINEDLLDISTDLNDDMTKVSNEILTLRRNTEGLVPEIGRFTKAFLWFKEKLANLVSAIPSAVKSIVKGGWAIIKGLYNSITSLVGAATQLLKFSITIPFTIAKAAADIGNVLRTEYVEVIQQAGEDLKEHFDFDSHIGEGIQKMTQRGKGMLIAFQSPSHELVKLFGMGSAGIANMIKEVGTNINAMGHFSEIFGRSIMGNARRTKNFTKMVRAFGFSAEDIHYMALDASTNLEHVNTRMAKLGVVLSTVSTEYGVDRKRLAKNFMILRKDIIQFGHLSDEEIAKTTANLTQMRVKLEDAAAVFKKFSTFEDAANSVAILSQTFGMNLDAFDMIQAKNPEEIINMFRNSMLETGRAFEDLNRFEKDLMAQHTGMSAESLAALMNYRDLGLTHEEAVKRMESERPEAKQMAALKKLNSAIKEIQKVMTFDSPFKAFGAGLAANTSLSGELQSVMVSLSKGYEGIYEYARTLDPKTWSGLVEPINYVIKIMRGIFESDAFKDGLVNTVEIMANFIGRVFDFSPYTKTLQAAQVTLSEGGQKLHNEMNSKVISVNEENVGNLVSLSGRIMGSIIKGAAIGFIAILRTANDGIAKLKTMMDATNPDKNLIETFFGWDPGDVVKMGTGLKNAFKDFMSNSSGMISLTGWLLSGFKDIFDVIVGIFGSTLLAGIDEIAGTKFSDRPGNILKKTAIKSNRKSQKATTASLSKSLSENMAGGFHESKAIADVDKEDIASMLHDLDEKISKQKNNTTTQRRLQSAVKQLKDTFKHEDTTRYQYSTIARQALQLTEAFDGNKFIGGNVSDIVNQKALKDKYAQNFSKQYFQLWNQAKDFDKEVKKRNPNNNNLKPLVSGYLDGQKLMDDSNGWNIQMRNFWKTFHKEIMINLRSSDTKLFDKRFKHNFFQSPVYPEFERKVLGKINPQSAAATQPTQVPGNTHTQSNPASTKTTQTKDLSILNNLMGISSSVGILRNLMDSVEVPYAPDASEYAAVSLIDDTYDDVSKLDLKGKKPLTKQKVQETHDKLCLLKEEVDKKNLEVSPEVVFDQSIIDMLMKTMAKSNLVRILGMPEYTNGVMNLAESAIGSRCFNVGSDGTAPTPEVIQPSS